MNLSREPLMAYLFDAKPLDDDLIRLLRDSDDENLGVLTDLCNLEIDNMQEVLRRHKERLDRLKANRECLRVELARRFPDSVCGEHPEITVSGPGGGGLVEPGSYRIVQAMADAFDCSEPRDHDGDHIARDVNGERLCWWPR